MVFQKGTKLIMKIHLVTLFLLLLIMDFASAYRCSMPGRKMPPAKTISGKKFESPAEIKMQSCSLLKMISMWPQTVGGA